MQQVYIKLVQTWDNIDSCIDYLNSIASDLEVLKKLNEQPSDLYLEVQEVAKGDTPDIILRNL